MLWRSKETRCPENALSPRLAVRLNSTPDCDSVDTRNASDLCFRHLLQSGRARSKPRPSLTVQNHPRLSSVGSILFQELPKLDELVSRNFTSHGRVLYGRFSLRHFHNTVFGIVPKQLLQALRAGRVLDPPKKRSHQSCAVMKLADTAAKVASTIDMIRTREE